MMAQYLRRVLYVFLIGAVSWVFFWWSMDRWVAVVGGFCLAFGFAPLLGAQFLTLKHANRRDASPQATNLQLIRAWWAEVILTIKVFVVQQAYREHRFGDLLPTLLSPTPSDTAVQTQAKSHQFAPENNQFPKKQQGVVFIHGFLCNRGFWNPWLARLQSTSTPYVALSLEPVFTSIDDYAQLVEAAVTRITTSTGMPPLLICHSMGGLAARAWLRADASNALRVSHIVTIGTPHHGTALARGPSFAPNATQMQKKSAWLADLAADEAGAQQQNTGHAASDSPPNLPVNQTYSQFTCFYSNCDNIVFPTLTATLDGADNRFVPGLAHVQMAFDEVVMRESLDKLKK